MKLFNPISSMFKNEENIRVIKNSNNDKFMWLKKIFNLFNNKYDNPKRIKANIEGTKLDPFNSIWAGVIRITIKKVMIKG